MAVIDDITGWREELDEFLSGPAYKKMYPKKIWNPKNDPLVPKSVVLDFVETLLAHEELRTALLDFDRWHKANPMESGPDPENDPTFPHKASNMQHAFAQWYMMKTGFGPRIAAYFAGLRLATLILNNEIADAHSPEADAFLKKTASIHIDPKI